MLSLNTILPVLLPLIFLAASGAFLFFRRKGATWDAFAPWRIFPAIWFFGLAFSSMHLSKFDSSWSILSYITFIIAPLYFLFGCLLYQMWEQRTIRPTLQDAGKLILPSTWNTRHALGWLGLLFGVCAAVLLFEIWHVGAIPFIDNPNVTRWEIGYNSYVHRIALTLIQVSALAAVIFVLHKNKKSFAGWLMIAIFAISTVFIFSLASRLFLLTALIVPFVAWNYLGRHFTRWQALAALGLAGLGTGVLSLVRFLSSDSAHFYLYMKKLGFSGVMAYFGPIYQNIAYNFEVFDRLITQIPSQLGFFYGKISAYPILIFAGEGQRITSVIGETDIAKSGFVASTYLGAFYADFGFVGVILGSILLGVGSAYLYTSMTEKPNPIKVLLYALVAWNLMFAIYENLFVLFDFWWAIAVFIVFDQVVSESSWLRQLWKRS